MGRLRWKVCIWLVGDGPSIWSSIWVHTDGMGVSPMRQFDRCQTLPYILHPGSHLGKVDLVYFVLMVTLMRMTHWDLPLLKAGSSSGLGTRWPLTWLMGSRNISHIWGLACSALFLSGWQWCLCFAFLFCTRGSGSPCWNNRVHWDGVCLSTPLPLGTLRGTLCGRILGPLGGFLVHS